MLRWRARFAVGRRVGFRHPRGPLLVAGLRVRRYVDTEYGGPLTPTTACATPIIRCSTKRPKLNALQYAAEQGQPAARWKDADGDGVPQDQMRAFNYFSEIANTHPDESGHGAGALR